MTPAERLAYIADLWESLQRISGRPQSAAYQRLVTAIRREVEEFTAAVDVAARKDE